MLDIFLKHGYMTRNKRDINKQFLRKRNHDNCKKKTLMLEKLFESHFFDRKKLTVGSDGVGAHNGCNDWVHHTPDIV